jgi:hypothetical protein
VQRLAQLSPPLRPLNSPVAPAQGASHLDGEWAQGASRAAAARPPSASGYRLTQSRFPRGPRVADVFRREVFDLRSTRGIRQRRYFDFIIRRVRDFWDKLEYIHQNPVIAGLANRPEDWSWSSYAAYAKCGSPPISD